MRRLRLFWRSVYDVRPGEGVRTLFMALHLMFVLFAYYILKPVSRALFLNKFDIDQLPYLYVLIALAGGLLAYAYTRVAVRASLKTAVKWATALSVLCLVSIWWLLRFNFNWMLYVLNIWVSLFSIVLVSQGWLAAANVFDSREAKRLYGLLGLGAVMGAAFGGEFTAALARLVEPRDLLLASAVMVILSYGAFLVVAAQKTVNLAGAKAAEAEEDFAFGDILAAIRKHRHLQVIMAIITLTFIVDVMVEYQFSAMAKAAFGRKEELTAYLGSFYGLYLNMVTFSLQLFLTSIVVRRIGVGGTLQIMPVVIGLASLGMMLAPRLLVASALRLGEAATRYSFNKTGMELLYLPLPTDLKNRTKAFVDIFMDRFGRGLGAMTLMGYSMLFVRNAKHPNVTHVSALVFGFCVIWVFLSLMASREYVSTIRRRLELRRLDLHDARITVTDAATIELLEKALREGTPRQAAYSLGLLAEAPGYDIGPLFERLVVSAAPEVRTKVYEAAGAAQYSGLREHAWRALAGPGDTREQQAAVAYLLAVAPDGPISDDWVMRAATDPDARRRSLAAYAIGRRGQDAGDRLRKLLDDTDPATAAAACRAAGALGNRMHFEPIVGRLSDGAVRGAAIESLARYGPRVCGSLGDILIDEKSPAAIRRQVPRVLRLIRDQRSVDVLLGSIGEKDIGIRTAVIKALNRLRESAPQLNFRASPVTQQILDEAKYYYELNAQLAPLRSGGRPQTAASLLARTIEARLNQTQERLFRLLGLRYSPNEIYNAYLAIHYRKAGEIGAALDYLDGIVERDLKRVLLPLFDLPGRVSEHGRHLFGIEVKSGEAAVRELVHSGDAWMAACAIAAAAELRLKALAGEIARVGELAGPETAQVARAAVATLA
jgi:AAA family ATP:ADP antiporter